MTRLRLAIAAGVLGVLLIAAGAWVLLQLQEPPTPRRVVIQDPPDDVKEPPPIAKALPDMGVARAPDAGPRRTRPDPLLRERTLAVLESHAPAVQECADKTSPRMFGAYGVTFTVLPNGTATNVRSTSRKFGGMPVSDCILELLEDVRFPPGEAPRDVSYAFKLR